MNKCLNCFFEENEKHRNIGLLILRIVIGVSFLIHGYPKITGGPDKWMWLGQQMGNLGITFFPVFWGFCAAVAEFFGGLFLIFGLGTRLMSAGLAFTMIVATVFHITSGDPIGKIFYPVELLSVFIFLILAGAGKFSFDHCIYNKLKK